MINEDEFASRLTAVLDRGVNEIDAATLNRLSSMRRQAISNQPVASRGLHALALLHRHGWASVMLALVILLAGWWFVQNSQPTYSAETDILLLTGDLPPNAYADKTFSQWLDTRSMF